MPRITRDALIVAATEVILMARQYRSTEPHREMRLDGLVFGYFQGVFGQITRQHQWAVKRGVRPQRIDYRQGGSRPVLIEFAARTPGRNEIYGSQNRDELRKLCRQYQTKVSARYLLLLDTSGRDPIERDALEPTYNSIHAGRGRFARVSARMVYVHPDLQYHFLWRPFAS